jgi:hypothetical protein
MRWRDNDTAEVQSKRRIETRLSESPLWRSSKMRRKIMRLILGNEKTRRTPSPRGERKMGVKVQGGL